MDAPPDPGSAAGWLNRMRRLFMSCVYALLLAAGAVTWTAPAIMLTVAPIIDTLAPSMSGWTKIFIAVAPPAAVVAMISCVAAVQTRFSSVAHRRLTWFGIVTAGAFGAGAIYWHLEYQAAMRIGGERFLPGIAEFLLTAACLFPAVGGVFLLSAGAWGRWVMNRGPATDVPGEA